MSEVCRRRGHGNAVRGAMKNSSILIMDGAESVLFRSAACHFEARAYFISPICRIDPLIGDVSCPQKVSAAVAIKSESESGSTTPTTAPVNDVLYYLARVDCSFNDSCPRWAPVFTPGFKSFLSSMLNFYDSCHKIAQNSNAI